LSVVTTCNGTTHTAVVSSRYQCGLKEALDFVYVLPFSSIFASYF